jgi:omega-6 fatty acid desaturase (delta-12 desaturase)
MPERDHLRRQVRAYQLPVLHKSLSQLATSFGGFFVTCAVMFALTDISYWLVPVLAPLAAGFLVRIFIIQHDCGHYAFFRPRWANDVVGFACSVLTLTPYASWRRQHAGHHGVWNDLDRRQSGADIYSSCLTVAEYRRLGPWSRLRYRIVRHPLVANIFLPPLVFLLLYRVPFDMPHSWRSERRLVHITTLAVVVIVGGLVLAIGYERVLAVLLPVISFGAVFGVWLFSVQHRGQGTRWTRRKDWNQTSAALQSSNFLHLPRILQWFTGNIGYHHVHHLNPRVPNYRLQECHDAVPPLHAAPRISFSEGMRALRLILWDEGRERMVTPAEAEAAGVPNSLMPCT